MPLPAHDPQEATSVDNLRLHGRNNSPLYCRCFCKIPLLIFYYITRLTLAGGHFFMQTNLDVLGYFYFRTSIQELHRYSWVQHVE